MITLRRSGERRRLKQGNHETWMTFDPGNPIDPLRRGFHALESLNEENLGPEMGPYPHPRDDAEIITYVLSGALQHKDSMGNGRVIRAGEVQYMAAGTGVQHSEFNPSPRNPGLRSTRALE